MRALEKSGGRSLPRIVAWSAALLLVPTGDASAAAGPRHGEATGRIDTGRFVGRSDRVPGPMDHHVDRLHALLKDVAGLSEAQRQAIEADLVRLVATTPIPRRPDRALPLVEEIVATGSGISPERIDARGLLDGDVRAAAADAATAWWGMSLIRRMPPADPLRLLPIPMPPDCVPVSERARRLRAYVQHRMALSLEWIWRATVAVRRGEDLTRGQVGDLAGREMVAALALTECAFDAGAGGNAQSSRRFEELFGAPPDVYRERLAVAMGRTISEIRAAAVEGDDDLEMSRAAFDLRVRPGRIGIDVVVGPASSLAVLGPAVIDPRDSELVFLLESTPREAVEAYTRDIQSLREQVAAKLEDIELGRGREPSPGGGVSWRITRPEDLAKAADTLDELVTGVEKAERSLLASSGSDSMACFVEALLAIDAATNGPDSLPAPWVYQMRFDPVDVRGRVNPLRAALRAGPFDRVIELWDEGQLVRIRDAARALRDARTDAWFAEAEALSRTHFEVLYSSDGPREVVEQRRRRVRELLWAQHRAREHLSQARTTLDHVAEAMVESLESEPGARGSGRAEGHVLGSMIRSAIAEDEIDVLLGRVGGVDPIDPLVEALHGGALTNDEAERLEHKVLELRQIESRLLELARSWFLQGLDALVEPTPAAAEMRDEYDRLMAEFESGLAFARLLSGTAARRVPAEAPAGAADPGR